MLRSFLCLDTLLLASPAHTWADCQTSMGPGYSARYGIALLMIAVLIYLTVSLTTSIYVIIAASVVSGIGAAMYFPANISAIMSSAEPEHYGAVSGLSRLTQSIGTLSQLCDNNNSCDPCCLKTGCVPGLHRHFNTHRRHLFPIPYRHTHRPRAFAAGSLHIRVLSFMRGKEDRTRCTLSPFQHKRKVINA